jgi:hypothetical protein
MPTRQKQSVTMRNRKLNGRFETTAALGRSWKHDRVAYCGALVYANPVLKARG